MGLEAGTFINDLNTSNPPGSDNILQGDDHLRLIKSVLKNTFPNADKAFYLPDYVSKAVDYTVLTADINKFIGVDSAAATRTITLPAGLVAANDGWCVTIVKEASANNVVISGTVNGVSGITVSAQWTTIFIWWNGTAFRGYVIPPYFTHATALTAPAVGDQLWVYDVDVTSLKSIELQQMLKVVDGLSAITAPEAGDELLVYDVSGTAAVKITGENFMKVINLLNEEPAPAIADKVPLYDASGASADWVSWARVNPFGYQLVHIQDQKASGTDGGGFTSGAYRTRTLNTVVTNEVSGASLSANQVTLPAGTYYLEARCAHDNVRLNKARWQNMSDSTTTLLGANAASDFGNHGGWYAEVRGRFTIAAEKVFQLQHRCSQTDGVSGFGQACGFGDTEIYTDLLIWKII